MKILLFAIMALFLGTCSPEANDIPPGSSIDIPIEPSATKQTKQDSILEGVVLFGAKQDSVPGMGIPGVCGTERMMRRPFWRVSGGYLFNHRSDTVRFNRHGYSCQEQLVLEDGFIYALQGAYAINQDGYSPDTAFYPQMCRKQTTYGPAFDSCWQGAWIYRKWAIQAGQMYDTVLIDRRYVSPSGQPYLVQDSLFRP